MTSWEDERRVKEERKQREKNERFQLGIIA